MTARVVDHELFEVAPRFQFLRLETADGAVGWGEPVVEGRAGPVRAAVDELMAEVVLGADPHDIEHLWQRMYRGGFYRGGPVLLSAIAGIDQALWDLKGTALGAPVHELLGGRARDRIRLYAHVPADAPAGAGDGESTGGADGRPTPEALARGAARKADEGYTALKTSLSGPFERIEDPATVDAAVERVAAIREAVGPAVDVAVDFHGKVSTAVATRLAVELEDHDPMFYEEPVLPEQAGSLPAVAASTSVPLPTGERLYSRWAFRDVLADGAVDVVQPDPSHAGGITEVRKIATMAAAHDAALAPHCPLGPIALAACLQVDACSPNALVQEQVVHREQDRHVLELLADPGVLDHDDGFVDVPAGPGLGVEIDEAVLRERAAEGAYEWSVPQLGHDDGGVAEW
ncbi:MAG: galactonate dehydratase [Halobacteriaceae archaeon]